MKSDLLAEQRNIFPALRNGIYADTAAAGLLYEPLIQWRRKHDLDLIGRGSGLWPEHIGILSDTRAAIRRFFHAEEAEVALVPNFSIGLNLLLENMDPDQGVLLLEDDYPSVNWPFEKRKFDISYVRADLNMERAILEKLRSKKIGVLAISLVQWLNGVKLASGFLADLKKEFPDLIIIADGTQSCGVFDLDFTHSGIDILGSSGYKWLLGGYGNGFMLFNKEILSRIHISSIGFNSASGEIHAKDQIPVYRQLEPGHLDSLNFGSLKHSLEFLGAIGMNKVEEQNRRLSNRAIRQFGALGLLEEEVLGRQDHGTIFRLLGDVALHEHLLHNGVRCSWRIGAIRLSFHFYNTELEIDRIADIIKKAI